MNNTIPPHFILVLGGARSGKSTFAERLASSSGRRVAFIATATAGDSDMRQRIAHHRANRPVGWVTIEEPLHIADAVRRAGEVGDVLLLDDMTLWLTNWMGQRGLLELDEAELVSDAYTADLLADVERFLEAVAILALGKTLIAVSNEVGLGVVPAYLLGRAYRDLLGRVNQRLARVADRVYLMVAGLAVDIKRLHEEASL